MKNSRYILSNLNYRIITTVIFSPLIVVIIFFLPFKFFNYIIIIICSLAAWEWTLFIGWTTKIKRIISAILFGIFLLSLQLLFNDFRNLITNYFVICILFIGLVWWLIAIILVTTFPVSAKFWSRSVILKILFGILIILPFYYGTLVLKSMDYYLDMLIGTWWLFYVILLTWSTDIGSYFFGNLFGKHKLASKISPNKTLEGMIGGMITAGVFIWLFNLFMPSSLISKKILFYSIITIIISIFGDLTESMFKRQSGIKDSSHLIPGHGGILDCIDSLTAAISIFAVLILLFF